MEKNGPKAKNIAGCQVLLFHRVLLTYLTFVHKANLYLQRLSVCFVLKKDEDLSESKGLVEQYYLGNQHTPQMFPVGKDAPESTQAHAHTHPYTPCTNM
jgi:hypothetical protein